MANMYQHGPIFLKAASFLPILSISVNKKQNDVRLLITWNYFMIDYKPPNCITCCSPESQKPCPLGSGIVSKWQKPNYDKKNISTFCHHKEGFQQQWCLGTQFCVQKLQQKVKRSKNIRGEEEAFGNGRDASLSIISILIK